MTWNTPPDASGDTLAPDSTSMVETPEIPISIGEAKPTNSNSEKVTEIGSKDSKDDLRERRTDPEATKAPSGTYAETSRKQCRQC